MKMKSILLFLAMLFLMVTPAFSQTRVFVDGQIGAGSFGFKSPHLQLGLSVDQTIFHRFTSETSFAASPDVKNFTNFGHSFNINETITTKVTNRLGLRTGVGYAIYWSGVPSGSNCPAGWTLPDGPLGQQCITTYTKYHKGAVNPYVGVEVKDAWFGSPGVLTVDYYIKTGYLDLQKIVPTECVFASAGNPCPITSPQETGIIAQQTFELWPRLNVGLQGGWINYGDQVNPFAPQLGQTRHNTWFTTAVLRYELTRPKKS